MIKKLLPFLFFVSGSPVLADITHSISSSVKFESTVVTLLPLILYEDPILSAVLAADKDSNFTLEEILCVMSQYAAGLLIRNKNGISFFMVLFLQDQLLILLVCLLLSQAVVL